MIPKGFHAARGRSSSFLRWSRRGGLGWRWRVRRARRAPPTEKAPDSPLGKLEAVLFLAREPLPLRRLAALANLADAGQARAVVRELQQVLDRSGSALEVLQVAGGWQLLTRAKLSPWLMRLGVAGADTPLAPSAMETLAVVAYRQPVVRAEVEAIRGVQCGELLRQLIAKDLLRIVGRSQELGRPLQYGTTREFLRRFGLRDLDDLPDAASFRRAV